MAVACRVGSGTRAGWAGVGAIITIACGVAKETRAGRYDQCTVLYCRGRTRLVNSGVSARVRSSPFTSPSSLLRRNGVEPVEVKCRLV